MKKISILLVALMLSVVAVNSAYAQTPATGSATPTKAPAKSKEGSSAADLKLKVQEVVFRIRQTVVSHVKVYRNASTHLNNILNKLQIRIDAAEKAGKDVTALKTLMTDAKTKLADANKKIADIEAKQGTALSKEEFAKIRADFKAVLADFKAVKEASNKIIKELKSFNSSTSSGKEKESTAAAKKDKTSTESATKARN